MKIKELMAILDKCDPDGEVVIDEGLQNRIDVVVSHREFIGEEAFDANGCAWHYSTDNDFEESISGHKVVWLCPNGYSDKIEKQLKSIGA